MNTLIPSNQEVENSIDFLPVLSMPFIEFYVEDALQSACTFIHVLGFQPHAYSGPDTGANKKSYVVKQASITIVFSSPIKAKRDIQRHCTDIMQIALSVKDASEAWEESTFRGAESFFQPFYYSGPDGAMIISGIHFEESIKHLFVQKNRYKGVFMPGFHRWEPEWEIAGDTGLIYVDSCNINLSANRFAGLAEFYSHFLGFPSVKRSLHSHSFRKETLYHTFLNFSVTALPSNLTINAVFPISKEPVICLSLASEDILWTINELNARGAVLINLKDLNEGHIEKKLQTWVMMSSQLAVKIVQRI
jgi:hypothetical protein